MPYIATHPKPLSTKPDLEDAARRWDAYFAGELIDRPVVCVTAPREGMSGAPGSNYHERVFGDLDDIILRARRSAEATYYGGEALPYFPLSFGPDETAAFCGAELGWSDESGDTNWSIPLVEDWSTALPLRLREDNPLWQRMLSFYRRAAELLDGILYLSTLDLHTNMDLLAALRGPQRLCTDLLDQPEMIDRAMASARAIFPLVWEATARAGRMAECGYVGPAATLQCDFSCMISPAMFRRWVLPALEEEAAIVGRVVYHWDGPGALVHTADLLASPRLHTLSYVPGEGHGSHLDHLDLLKRVQAGGKAVQVWGPPEQMQALHHELRPEKTMYCTNCATQSEAEALLEWFVKHT